MVEDMKKIDENELKLYSKENPIEIGPIHEKKCCLLAEISRILALNGAEFILGSSVVLYKV